MFDKDTLSSDDPMGEAAVAIATVASGLGAAGQVFELGLWHSLPLPGKVGVIDDCCALFETLRTLHRCEWEVCSTTHCIRLHVVSI